MYTTTTENQLLPDIRLQSRYKPDIPRTERPQRPVVSPLQAATRKMDMENDELKKEKETYERGKKDFF